MLELVDLLKGRVIVCKSAGIYFIRPSRKQLQLIESLPNYQNDKSKKILISPEDYNKSMTEIIAIVSSYWLPEEIKAKMEFLKISGINKFNDKSFDNYVLFDFRASADENWFVPFPEITFEGFNSSLHDLVLTIENWLRKHSGIELNLKLEEPNPSDESK